LLFDGSVIIAGPSLHEATVVLLAAQTVQLVMDGLVALQSKLLSRRT